MVVVVDDKTLLRSSGCWRGARRQLLTGRGRQARWTEALSPGLAHKQQQQEGSIIIRSSSSVDRHQRERERTAEYRRIRSRALPPRRGLFASSATEGAGHRTPRGKRLQAIARHRQTRRLPEGSKVLPGCSSHSNSSSISSDSGGTWARRRCQLRRHNGRKLQVALFVRRGRMAAAMAVEPAAPVPARRRHHRRGRYPKGGQTWRQGMSGRRRHTSRSRCTTRSREDHRFGTECSRRECGGINNRSLCGSSFGTATVHLVSSKSL